MRIRAVWITDLLARGRADEREQLHCAAQAKVSGEVRRCERMGGPGQDEQEELVEHVAGLPSELVDDDQEAKQFDLLVLRLQLALLRHEKSFERWSQDVRDIAGALEEKASIPMVRAELELIYQIGTDEFWQDITTPILENVRKRLRSLVKFVEKTRRISVYTDFLDLMG